MVRFLSMKLHSYEATLPCHDENVPKYKGASHLVSTNGFTYEAKTIDKLVDMSHEECTYTSSHYFDMVNIHSFVWTFVNSYVMYSSFVRIVNCR